MKLLLTIVVLFLYSVGTKLKAQDKDYKAYSLFVYNFMKYTEWPEENSKGDFVLVIYGNSKIEKELKNLAAQKKLKGRNIQIKCLSNIDESLDCNLIYISDEKSQAVKDIILRMKTKSVLIVGEREGLASKGASLSFAELENDELSFDINKKALEIHKLKISSSLLKLGSVVVK
ncbi:MAG: YfiR family protein [Bacteroidota bacterium]